MKDFSTFASLGLCAVSVKARFCSKRKLVKYVKLRSVNGLSLKMSPFKRFGIIF